MKRRVVITGMGAVTPIGNTMTETWNGIVEGRKSVGPIRNFAAEKFPCNFAYQVDGFDLIEDGFKHPDQKKFLNRAGRYGWNAAHEALNQSQISQYSKLNRRRFSVCLGVGMGAANLKWYADVYLRNNLATHESVPFYHRYFPSTLTTVLGALTGAQGGNTTVHTACASSGQATGEAFEMIASGDADVVLTGGADSMINPFQVAGFCLLGALSSRVADPNAASRPFDKDRDGFVLGEGAAMFVFEEYEHAKRRGATILGEICGYGVTESAYRITDLHPEGRGTIEAMKMALDDANISASDIGYINAHGTSTLLNDRVESLAISRVFPKEDCDVIVGSTKSMTGHLISAAGALEFAVAVLALQNKVIPPNVNLTASDPDCQVNLAGSEPKPFLAEYALSNSIGFGGSNTSLVAKRYEA